jgi:S1-C subfamily serine protease
MVPALQAHGQDLRALFRRASPSVVLIHTAGTTIGPTSDAGLVSAAGVASGVVVSADGKVITAAHAVQTADQVSVQLTNGRVVSAHVLGSVQRADLALLQLDPVPPELVPAKIGNSDSLEVGEQIFVIGAPFGIGSSLTAGHVAGRHVLPDLVSGERMELIQTDASVNAGNSGGPMFNMSGEVVGIVSRILTMSGGYEGMSFAVSVNVARKLLLERPSFWTGADELLLTDTLARVFNVPQSAGLLVQRVAAGSPAAQLGLRSGMMRITIAGQELLAGGDVILQIGDVPITADPTAFDRMHDYLSALKPGGQISMRILRDGRIMTLTTSLPSQ